MLAFVENGSITKYQVTTAEVKNKYPNTCFPEVLEGEDLLEFGIVTVERAEQPSFDSNTHAITEGDPQLVDNVWKQTWVLTPHDQAKLDAINEKAKSTMRLKRDRLLSESDWTQLPDASVNASDCTAYRQALRDVPSQSEFPNNITWPTKP